MVFPRGETINHGPGGAPSQEDDTAVTGHGHQREGARFSRAISRKTKGRRKVGDRSEKGRIWWFPIGFTHTKMQEGFRTPRLLGLRNLKDGKMHFGIVAQASVINEYESGKAISLIWSSCLA